MRDRSARRLALPATGIVLAAVMVSAPRWQPQLVPLVRGSASARVPEPRERVSGDNQPPAARGAEVASLVPGH